MAGNNSALTRQNSNGQLQGKNDTDWLPDEDECLRQLVYKYGGKKWKTISKCLNDRYSPNECYRRWAVLQDYGSAVKQPWTPDEDKEMLTLIERYGPSKWAVIASYLPGRNGKQCRERWHNQLNPSIKKDPWTLEEDLIIIELQAKYGNRWAKITERLPGRTDNAIKNHWHSSMKMKLDKYAEFTKESLEESSKSLLMKQKKSSRRKRKTKSRREIAESEKRRLKDISATEPLTYPGYQVQNLSSFGNVIAPVLSFSEESSKSPNDFAHENNDLLGRTNEGAHFLDSQETEHGISVFCGDAPASDDTYIWGEHGASSKLSVYDIRSCTGSSGLSPPSISVSDFLGPYGNCIGATKWTYHSDPMGVMDTMLHNLNDFDTTLIPEAILNTPLSVERPRNVDHAVEALPASTLGSNAGVSIIDSVDGESLKPTSKSAVLDVRLLSSLEPLGLISSLRETDHYQGTSHHFGSHDYTCFPNG